MTTSELDYSSVATLTRLSKWYGDNQILTDVDLHVHRKEIVALVGRSGSGKSTILRVLAGLSDDHSGEANVFGRSAIAFQEPRLFPWRSVRDNVSYGVHSSRGTARNDRDRVNRTLDEVGLADKYDAWPGTLSGGQAQRAALARALVGEPEFLLLDEPFGALDALTRLTMQDLLLSLWERHGFGVLVVTHDVDEALALADRVLVLNAGSIVDETVVDLPRPRNRGTAQFAQLRTHLLAALGIA